MLKKLYKKCLLYIMNSKTYYHLLMKIIPYIRLTTYYTGFRGYQFNRGYQYLKPGDFVLTRDNKKLTTFLVPGEWTHAAQVVAVGGDWEISEMTHEHYTRSCFFDVCAQSDRVAIYRCTAFDEAYIYDVVIPTCKSFSKAVYDVEFEGAETSTSVQLSLGIPALYCSELVYQSDPERRIGADLTDLVGLDLPYISPDDLSEAKNVVCVWDSEWEKSRSV
jgi:hypothetical protein